jgi:PAS domain S-box-containing protein
MGEDIGLGVGTILDCNPVPMFVIDLQPRLVFWNRACERVTGKPAQEMIGTDNHLRIFYDRERPTMADLMVEGAKPAALREHYGDKHLCRSHLLDGACEAEDYFPHMGEDGVWLYFTAAPLLDADGHIVGAIETLQDVSDRHRAEEALVRHQKNLEKLVKKRTGELVETQQQLVQSEKLASLGQLAAGVAHEIKYRANVVREYGEVPPVECMPAQLNQVFMNLLVNAAQAMSEGRRGTITVRCGADKDGSDEAWVEVADDGCGISPENLKKIFDPFFTTKPVGKGTGLGLSLSFGIVEKHHGRIEVHSAPGAGAAFRVTLPVRQIGKPGGT